MCARTVLSLLLLLSPGCLWRSYGDVLRVHLDVLGGMADKAVYNAQTGQRPTSNEVTELTYPLQRARQFAYQYRSYGDRESYRLLVAALDRYQVLAEAIDAARGDAQRWEAERAQIGAQYQAWRDAADQVRAALAREGSS
jgi:hypothetical protein